MEAVLQILVVGFFGGLIRDYGPFQGIKIRRNEGFHKVTGYSDSKANAETGQKGTSGSSLI